MNSIESNFVPYQIAVDMKSIGFDEPCFGYFDPLLGDYTIMNSDCINPKPTLFNHNSSSIVVSAPTFSQAFRFFREKYKIFPYTYTGNGNLFHYCMFIKDRDNQYHSNNLYLSNEEAELECLKELIEIVKRK